MGKRVLPSLATVASMAAGIAGILVIGFWGATEHPYLTHWKDLPTFAWAGAVSGYALIRAPPHGRMGSVVASGVALVCGALLIVDLRNGFIRPRSELLPWYFLQCTTCFWAANLSLLSSRLVSGHFAGRGGLSRARDTAYRVARLCAAAVIFDLTILGIYSVASWQGPDWLRHGLLPAAFELILWICVMAATAAAVGAFGSGLWAYAVPFLLVGCAIVNAITEWQSPRSVVARLIGFALSLGVAGVATSAYVAMTHSRAADRKCPDRDAAHDAESR